ncbi:MAG: hypothetical protein AAGF35_14025, partial [Pseudomonadota bacterium]
YLMRHFLFLPVFIHLYVSHHRIGHFTSVHGRLVFDKLPAIVSHGIHASAIPSLDRRARLYR